MKTGGIDLIPEGTGIVPTPNCSCGLGFCQTFAPSMSRWQPNTAEKANSYSRGAALLDGIVKSGES